MRQGQRALFLRTKSLEDALPDGDLVGMSGSLRSRTWPADAGRNGAPARRPRRARRSLLGHEDVADRDDDRTAHGEEAGVQKGQPGPDGRPRAPHIRYPLPTTVSISGGAPSFRRSRVIVTATMLLNGSALTSHTCSSSSSALTSAPSAASSISRTPNSFRVRDSEREPRLTRCRARSTARSPRRSTGGADGARRESARTRATSSAKAKGLPR